MPRGICADARGEGLLKDPDLLSGTDAPSAGQMLRRSCRLKPALMPPL
jgi:hypothetical protein